MDLPLNEKEDNNHSRTRIAYHVFDSRDFFDLKGLSETEKKDIVLSTPYLREDAEDVPSLLSSLDEGTHLSDVEAHVSTVNSLQSSALGRWAGDKLPHYSQTGFPKIKYRKCFLWLRNQETHH